MCSILTFRILRGIAGKFDEVSVKMASSSDSDDELLAKLKESVDTSFINDEMYTSGAVKTTKTELKLPIKGKIRFLLI